MSAAVEVGQRRRWNDGGNEFVVLFVGEQNAFIRYDSGSEAAYTIDYLAKDSTIVTPRPEWADKVGEVHVLLDADGRHVMTLPSFAEARAARWGVVARIDHDTWMEIEVR